MFNSNFYFQSKLLSLNFCRFIFFAHGINGWCFFWTFFSLQMYFGCLWVENWLLNHSQSDYRNMKLLQMLRTWLNSSFFPPSSQFSRSFNAPFKLHDECTLIFCFDWCSPIDYFASSTQLSWPFVLHFERSGVHMYAQAHQWPAYVCVCIIDSQKFELFRWDSTNDIHLPKNSILFWRSNFWHSKMFLTL